MDACLLIYQASRISTASTSTVFVTVLVIGKDPIWKSISGASAAIVIKKA